MIKLTPRQRAFLDKLRDLYRERRGPVHYSAVAERLGVSKFSAYDMLRLLEKKGMAGSEYLLSAKQGGPGRSQVVFYPTAAARANQSVSGEGEERWTKFKQRLLSELRDVRDIDYREKLLDLLSRLSNLRAPLEYCAETIAALLLTLDSIRQEATELAPLRSMGSLLTAGETGLGTLAGLSLGSMLAIRYESSLSNRLLNTVRRYQDYVSQLSEENKNRLTDFLREALVVFQSPDAHAESKPSL